MLLVHIAQAPPARELSNLVYDAYQRAAPRPYQDAGVRIVDIDDETIARLGQWPWPRTDVARLNDRLAHAGAAAIGYDIVFSEPDRTSPARIAAVLRANPLAQGDYADIARLPDHDILLGRSFAQTPSVAGMFLTRDRGRGAPDVKAGFAITGSSPINSLLDFNGAIGPRPQIGKDAAGVGFVSIVGGGDGIIRSAPLLAHVGPQIVPSLSLESLRVAQGAGAIVIKSSDASGEFGGGAPSVVSVKVGQFSAPTTSSGDLWMYYTASHPERVTPAWKILTGALSDTELKTLFEGRIVLVGTGSAGLQDLVSTPINDRELGVVVHAQALEQIILQKFLIRPDWGDGVETFVILLLGVAMSFLLPALGALRGGGLALVALFAAMATSWVAFSRFGLLLDPTLPALAVILVYMTGTLFSFLREERARSYIHHAFDRFLSPELVRRIARDPGQLELGGEERIVTVMFCDIRGFSRISERLSPQQIIRFLIEFLTPMTDILLNRKATIDKYIGDAILAFWNAPLDDPEHERNAALATLMMIEKIRQMNAIATPASGSSWPGEVAIGIGVGTGMACVGNIGSRQRLNYSLIGDTVNLASRLEGLTKQYFVPIMINEQLASRVPDFAVLELDQVRVVGRDTPERIYGLIGSPELAQESGFQVLAQRHHEMLCAYRGQKWEAAEDLLSEMAAAADSHGLSRLHGMYRERIHAFIRSPPEATWDGVFSSHEK